VASERRPQTGRPVIEQQEDGEERPAFLRSHREHRKGEAQPPVTAKRKQAKADKEDHERIAATRDVCDGLDLQGVQGKDRCRNRRRPLRVERG